MPTDQRTDRPVGEPTIADQAAARINGLDTLELGASGRSGRFTDRLWRSTWPKLLAILLAVLIWQLVVWSGWRPEFVLPSPLRVWEELSVQLLDSAFWDAIGLTMGRAVTGFAIAVVVGGVVGAAVARFAPLRAAIGSLITGLQTMPSIIWFPLAILLFQLSENAILFVVVLGAAPSIANGLITGIDYVPTAWRRAGRVLGLRGVGMYRHVILPASLPSFVSGLKQGWAFAWRSLMAGELLVIVPGALSIGVRLQGARELNDAPLLIAYIIVVLIIGIIVDMLFNTVDSRLRRRWGLEAGQ